MSATSIAVPANPPPGGPTSFVAAFSTDLSHSPVLGIIGVTLAARTVTVTGRLLTLGLADPLKTLGAVSS